MRKSSTAFSSTPAEARNSSGESGTNRWIVSTGEPIAAANSALRSIPARASSSRRSTRTNAPLGQATGASAVTAMPTPDPASIARASARLSATCLPARQSSIPRHGPPSRRSASWSGSGAAFSSGIAAEPVDIGGDSFLQGPDGEIYRRGRFVTLVLASREVASGRLNLHIVADRGNDQLGRAQEGRRRTRREGENLVPAAALGDRLQREDRI